MEKLIRRENRTSKFPRILFIISYIYILFFTITLTFFSVQTYLIINNIVTIVKIFSIICKKKYIVIIYMETKSLVYCLIVGVLINLILPKLLKPLATPDQIKPPQGAEKLSFFDQIMHMFIHHEQVPVTSSIIIVVVVYLSIKLGPHLEKIFNGSTNFGM